MAAITVQSVPEGGLASVTFASANGGGDTVAVGSRRAGGWDSDLILLLVRNTNGASRDITVGSNAAVTIPATTGVSIIPVYSEGVNDASVAVTYSAVTNVDVAAVRVGA